MEETSFEFQKPKLCEKNGKFRTVVSKVSSFVGNAVYSSILGPQIKTKLKSRLLLPPILAISDPMQDRSAGVSGSGGDRRHIRQ